MTIKLDELILELENIENQLNSNQITDAKSDLNFLIGSLEDTITASKFTADNLGPSPMFDNKEVRGI